MDSIPKAITSIDKEPKNIHSLEDNRGERNICKSFVTTLPQIRQLTYKN